MHAFHYVEFCTGFLFFPMTKNIIAESVNDKDQDLGNIITFNNLL